MRSWRTLQSLALCALLGACAHSVAPPVVDGAIAVASDASLQLLPAQDVLHDVTLTQRIDASYAKADAPAQTRSFVVQVEAGSNDMRMVGLTPMGVQLFAVTLVDRALAVDVPPYLSLPFDPRYMLADMQLALADIALLNTQLAGAQLRVAGNGLQRELVTDNGVVRLRIAYQGSNGGTNDGKACAEGDEMSIEHLERHYRIHITTLSCERL